MSIMKNLAICNCDNAIKVSDTYVNLIPAIKETVICIYKVKISTQKHLMIKITWCNLKYQGFTIDISCSSSNSDEHSMELRETIGKKTIELFDSKMKILWDLSHAAYDVGPEPISGYYIMVFVKAELCLLIGDMEEESELDTKNQLSNVLDKSTFVSRTEYFLGNTIYSTKAKFSDSGKSHNISIKCIGSDKRNSVLNISIDNKNVVEVNKLPWNFRGNEKLFIDGVLVDMMWDVHSWFSNKESGFAIFMFKTRNGMDSRLWFEEKYLEYQEQGNLGFSLSICAGKNPD